jgi:hypothetical protein
MNQAEFAREIRKARSDEGRVARFGALLARESRKLVEVVGGSAIEIYLSSSVYVTQDIDLVGDPESIARVLQGWGFRQVRGRSQRLYWSDGLVGLIDVVGPADRSGLPPRKIPTPVGPVLVTSPEPLIVRRLFRAEREKSEELFRQAVALGRLGGLDWEYLRLEARYEKVEAQLAQLRKIVGSGRRRLTSASRETKRLE